ncbi:MAG: hypothetical protein KME20_12740 [Kaiparowitsia implicata GSE-PSE-MK54-09C]|jgi:hypothetical protein|nr:hypothetical protein [Kaiparowitsia implicata GSE-PSE-MK54-09C]
MTKLKINLATSSPLPTFFRSCSDEAKRKAYVAALELAIASQRITLEAAKRISDNPQP